MQSSSWATRYRASVFNNNGAGVRGDMGAVVKAILLDDEARNQTTRNRTDFGKLREPLLRYAAMYRAFEADGDGTVSIQLLQPQLCTTGRYRGCRAGCT